MDPWFGSAVIYGYIFAALAYAAISKRRHRVADLARMERYVARTLPRTGSVTPEQVVQICVLAASAPGMARFRRALMWPLHAHRLLHDDPMSAKSKRVEEATARFRDRNPTLAAAPQPPSPRRHAA